MAKHAKEKYKTKHGVFDEFTNRTLFKLISSGHFIGLESPICIGKESNVFTAKKKDGDRVIVKIYRLETCDFNIMYNYIKNDPRYANIRRKKRNVIFEWVQREYRNLLISREAKVNVPTPITFKNNILVLEFIGEGDEIAPKLKDKVPKNKKQFYEKIVNGMKRLYKAGLVHADLSSFNILNFNETPVIIDMSQSTTLNNPQAQEFLERDAKNISQFFNKHDYPVKTEEIINNIKKQT